MTPHAWPCSPVKNPGSVDGMEAARDRACAPTRPRNRNHARPLTTFLFARDSWRKERGRFGSIWDVPIWKAGPGASECGLNFTSIFIYLFVITFLVWGGERVYLDFLSVFLIFR